MAVSFYRSATNPTGQQFTLKGLFACCYGGGKGAASPSEEHGKEMLVTPKDNETTPKDNETTKDDVDFDDGSDESDEEIRQNFKRARENSVALQRTGSKKKYQEENGEGTLREEREDPPAPIFGDALEDHFSTPSEENSALLDEQFAKYGVLSLTTMYERRREKLVISVNQVKDIPTDRRAGTAHYQVRMTMLPAKKTRFKTKIRQGDSPYFEELFQFSKITSEEIADHAIRFRLYNVEKLRREKAVSETVFNLSSIDLEEEKTYNLVLASCSALKSGYGTSDSQLDLYSDAGSTTTSMASATLPPGDPELLLGLTYNGTTGRLAVEIIKGSSLRANTHKPPDSFVNVCLMSANGQTIASSKTTSRKGQPNPLFRETFMFQVAHFQLTDITLMVNVYNKKAMNRKELIGWFSIGLNCSGEEELRHWQDMKEAQGDQVCRWHVLQDSSTS